MTFNWSVWSRRSTRIATTLTSEDAAVLALCHGAGTKIRYGAWIVYHVSETERLSVQEVARLAARLATEKQQKARAKRTQKSGNVQQTPFSCRPSNCTRPVEDCNEDCPHHKRLAEFRSWVEGTDAQQLPWPREHEWVATVATEKGA